MWSTYTEVCCKYGYKFRLFFMLCYNILRKIFLYLVVLIVCIIINWPWKLCLFPIFPTFIVFHRMSCLFVIFVILDAIVRISCFRLIINASSLSLPWFLLWCDTIKGLGSLFCFAYTHFITPRLLPKLLRSANIFCSESDRIKLEKTRMPVFSLNKPWIDIRSHSRFKQWHHNFNLPFIRLGRMLTVNHN